MQLYDFCELREFGAASRLRQRAFKHAAEASAGSGLASSADAAAGQCGRIPPLLSALLATRAALAPRQRQSDAPCARGEVTGALQRETVSVAVRRLVAVITDTSRDRRSGTDRRQ